MAYATPADLRGRFGVEIDDLIIRDGVPQESILATAIADAEAEIDGYLAARYQLPLPNVPALIARIACDIARYRLWEDRASPEVRQRYEDARRLLEAIGKGVVSLGLPADLPDAARPRLSLAAAKSGPPPVFGPEQMGGY